MKLTIDASNIIAGGGLTHLTELLNHVEPTKYGFDKIVVWASDKTLEKLPDNTWIQKERHNFLNKGYFYRFIWKQFIFKLIIDKDSVVFIPGTGSVSNGPKVVTMCQNLLPLEKEELDRFYPSLTWLRLLILKYLHLRAFRKADGVIFLNDYCYTLANKLSGGINNYAIIPHGVNNEFKYCRNTYDFKGDFNLLYVSTLDIYKHQGLIAEGVLELREEGFPISLTLIGESYSSSEDRLRKVLNKFPKQSQHVNWLKTIAYNNLPKYYIRSDAFIYGSTCETFGMTLLEAMAASLPIACSNKSSMENMLKDAGVYFDPEDIKSIKKAILQLFRDQKLRLEIGKRSYQLASNYCWEKTTAKTFQFLSEIAFK